MASKEGYPFVVNGEQIEFAPPEGWKLTWMSGSANGPYIAEYIPAEESIDTWRKGYLAIQRLALPKEAVLKNLKEANIKLADAMMSAFVSEANKTCDGTNTPMPQESITFNGLYFAISGGFCDKFGAIAPFGEGALIAFAEGEHYWYKIEYAWRPDSQEELNNLPWRIEKGKGIDYMNSIRLMRLCGGPKQLTCKITYTGKFD
jgi:hypothetical protein